MLHDPLFDDIASSCVLTPKRRTELLQNGILVSQNQSFGCRERQLCDCEIVLQRFLQIFRAFAATGGVLPLCEIGIDLRRANSVPPRSSLHVLRRCPQIHRPEIALRFRRPDYGFEHYCTLAHRSASTCTKSSRYAVTLI